MSTRHKISVHATAGSAQQQAMTLAKALSAKGFQDMRGVANSNPALLREWVTELTEAHEQAKRDTEMFHAVLDKLRAAERGQRRDVAA